MAESSQRYATVGFKLETGKIAENLKLLNKNTKQKVESLANDACKNIVEPYAKTNARWKNRTWRARKGLNAKVEKKGLKYNITIAHGVWYGVRLETLFEKRYAILEETIKMTSPQILASYKNLLDKCGFIGK